MTKDISLPYTTKLKGVWYYRRRGGASVRIQGEPGSPEFLKHYDDLKRGRQAVRRVGGVVTQRIANPQPRPALSTT